MCFQGLGVRIEELGQDWGLEGVRIEELGQD